MKKLFEAADRYMSQSTWKTAALMKFCLVSLGVMAGMTVRKEHRKPVLCCAASVFVCTYIPLMAGLFRVFKDS